LKEDSAHSSDKERDPRIGEFGALVDSTPALRAAWGKYRDRVGADLSGVLAAELDVDPRDPEPLVSAGALVGLLELLHDARLRHSRTSASARELSDLVNADIDRGARRLEAGVWSLQLIVDGRLTKGQISDAAVRAEQERRQVLAAVREAKRTWREIRKDARANTAGRETRQVPGDSSAQPRANAHA
jgi:hypothetical protein